VPLGRVLDILIDGGVSVAVITRGADDAYLASGIDRVSVPAVKSRVADTVGAGDSFMAALIWSLVFQGAGWNGRSVSGDRLEETGRAAARAAAITVSRTGADLPTFSELKPEREGV
jgi:fructokinase